MCIVCGHELCLWCSLSISLVFAIAICNPSYRQKFMNFIVAFCLACDMLSLYKFIWICKWITFFIMPEWRVERERGRKGPLTGHNNKRVSNISCSFYSFFCHWLHSHYSIRPSRLALLFRQKKSTDLFTFSVYNCTLRGPHFRRLMECMPKRCLSIHF